MRVITNNPLRKILLGPSNAGHLIPGAIQLTEFDIEFRSRKGINAKVVVDVVADFYNNEEPEPEGELT